MNIMTTIEVSPEPDGFYVIVSINSESISKHGPILDIDTAEKVQAEQAAIAQKTLQEHVKRLRERLAMSLDAKLSEQA
jgi:hypothetical protein